MNPAQSQPSQFPKIYRFITEYALSDKQAFYFKLAASSFFSGILLLGIALQALLLVQSRQQAALAAEQREQAAREARHWEAMADKYKGYRDLYYRSAALNYRLGNVAKSKAYLKKALEADPNFEEARVLGAKVGL